MFLPPLLAVLPQPTKPLGFMRWRGAVSPFWETARFKKRIPAFRVLEGLSMFDG
jgi:hypothetical protein